MTLPKINNVPKYTITIPSTQKQVRFRPFLVKEEKVLMLAFESKDKSQILYSIADTVLACIDDKIDRNSLTTFDVEYLFVKIRAKSVGETVEVGMGCTECSNMNKVSINVDDIKIDVPSMPNTIDLTDDIKIKMRWPRYVDVIRIQATEAEQTSTNTLTVLAHCIDSIITPDNVFKTSDESEEEVLAFIEQLNKRQLNSVQKYVEAMPQLRHVVEYKCSCGHDNVKTLQGIQDFF